MIEMKQLGPELQQQCFGCGHCVAVCPEGALDHTLAPLAKQVPIGDFPVLDAATAARFLRSRRSIRCYKQESVPKEVLLQLLDIARFAPSGCNSQGLSYVVVTKRELMEKLTGATVQWLEEQIRNNAAWAMPFAGLAASYRNTKRDVILRDAPHLIVATAPKEHIFAKVSARYSLAYVELLAPALGLGTCWAGFLEACAFSGNPELYRLLDIGKNLDIAGAVMAGYPCYTYQRLVDRNPLEVAWR
jgi:nitroreductase